MTNRRKYVSTDGTRCLIVGTGKNIVMPPPTSYSFVIAANGGLEFCESKRANVLVTTAYLCRRGPSIEESNSLESWSGATVETIYVDETDGKAAIVAERAQELGLTYSEIIGITPELRNGMVESACGLPLGAGSPDERVSTAIFGVCLALGRGADSVLMVGISFQDGHAGKKPDNHPRHHLEADKKCLRALAMKHPGKLSYVLTEDSF
jgi:hypothetical protein